MPQYTFLIGATALATTSAARGTEDGDIILIVKASTNQPSSNPEAEALVFASAQQAAADAISAALLDDPNALDSPNAEISAHIANAKGPSFTVTKRSLAYVTAQWRRLVQQPQASPPNHPPPPPQPQADPRVGRLISGRIPTRFLNNQPVWSDIVNAKVVRRTEDVEDSYLIDSDQAGLFYLDGTSVDLFSAPAPPERDVLHLPSSSPSEQLVIQQLAIIKRAPFSRALSDPAHLDAQEAWEILKLMRPASANQPIPSLPFLQHVLSFHAPSLHMVTVTNLPPNPTLAEIVAALSEALMRAPFVPPAFAPADPLPPRAESLDLPQPTPPQPFPLPPSQPLQTNSVSFSDPSWSTRYPLAAQMAAAAASQQDWDDFLDASCDISDPERAATIRSSEYTKLGALSRHLRKHVTSQKLQSIIDDEQQGGAALETAMLINVLLSLPSQTTSDGTYAPHEHLLWALLALSLFANALLRYIASAIISPPLSCTN
jgi:hypothetical protein